MKTEIERIALTLPAGFAERAAGIAHLLGEALAEQAQSAGLGVRGAHHEVVTPERVRVDAHASDALIARSIARAIIAALRADAARPAVSPEDA